MQHVHQINTPILLIVFNRLETTRLVFQAIRRARPLRLYVVSDGARSEHFGESEVVDSVRRYIETNIDWPCTLYKKYSDANAGCMASVTAGISWFFENEELGIILEDDCLPSQSFFLFCDELLKKYINDTRIGQISGYNYIANTYNIKESYLYATSGSIWGWATWGRVARGFNPMDSYLVSKEAISKIQEFGATSDEIKHIVKSINTVITGDVDTWDYSWSAYMRINKYLTIIPCKNMIRNIGFGPNATHTKISNSYSIPSCDEIEFPLIHPLHVTANHAYKTVLINEIKKISGHKKCMQRIKYKIKQIVSKILTTMQKAISWQMSNSI